MVGPRLGKYTLERPIGSGGMGDVYLASFSGPGGFARQVAIKLIRPALVASPKGRELFLQEGLALAALSHRNIVQVIELAGEADDLYLVMEYLDGVDLGRVMRREGALPWQVAVYAVAEAARGVAAAHARRIVHSDVTPSNVFLCADGAVKVLDFGLARPAGPAVVEGGGVRGKLPYLPPEVLLGAAADALADVYGLGAVLHECLTGQPLFRAGNDPETVWRALRDPVAPPSELADVPRELDRVVAQAMARDQSARTRSASALADRLDACLDGAFTAADLARWLPERIAAAPPEPAAASSLAATRPQRAGNLTELETPLERRPRARRRSRAAVWIAAAGGAALAIAGAVLLIRSGRDHAAPTPPPLAAPAPPPAAAAEPEAEPEPETAPAPALAETADPPPALAEAADPPPGPRARPRRKKPVRAPAAAPKSEPPPASGLAPGTLADPFR